jgi:hypothetical protein
MIALNLVWEVAQLPLYTLWVEATPGEIAFAILHCTGGDAMIAAASLSRGRSSITPTAEANIAVSSFSASWRNWASPAR